MWGFQAFSLVCRESATSDGLGTVSHIKNGRFDQRKYHKSVNIRFSIKSKAVGFSQFIDCNVLKSNTNSEIQRLEMQAPLDVLGQISSHPRG